MKSKKTPQLKELIRVFS